MTMKHLMIYLNFDVEKVQEATAASQARTKVIHAEIARLQEARAASEARTEAMRVEFAGLQGLTQDYLNETVERRSSMLGGIEHRQISARDLHVHVPDMWSEQPPSSYDHKLVGMIRSIIHNLETPR